MRTKKKPVVVAPVVVAPVVVAPVVVEPVVVAPVVVEQVVVAPVVVEQVVVEQVVEHSLFRRLMDWMMEDISAYLLLAEARLKLQNEKQQNGLLWTFAKHPFDTIFYGANDPIISEIKFLSAQSYVSDFMQQLIEAKVGYVTWETKIQSLSKATQVKIAEIQIKLTDTENSAAKYDAWLSVNENTLQWLLTPEVLEALVTVLNYEREYTNKKDIHKVLSAQELSLTEEERDAKALSDSMYTKLLSDLLPFLFTTIFELHVDAAKTIQKKLGHTRIVPKEITVMLTDKIMEKISDISAAHESFEHKEAAQVFSIVCSHTSKLLRDSENLHNEVMGVISSNTYMTGFIEKLKDFNSAIESLDPNRKPTERNRNGASWFGM